MFKKYGYEFYNYMDGEDLEMTDDNFVDGFHGSEIVYGCIIEDMATNGSVIKQYADLDNMQRMINNTYSGYVFEDPFVRNRGMT